MHAGARGPVFLGEEKQQFLTGLIFVDPTQKDFVELLYLVDEPLATLRLERVRPPKSALDEIMQSLK